MSRYPRWPSYLVQIYSSLRERNMLALTVDLMTDGTGDAAVMLARLMPGGNPSSAVSELGNLARALAAMKEAHHFYPLLFYFRFEQPFYAVSRFIFVLLDTVTLIETTLDERRYAKITASGAVQSIDRGARLLLETLDANFPTAADRKCDASREWRLRQSYVVATITLAGAGIALRSDGVDAYVAQRREWEPFIRRVAPTLSYDMLDIDRRAATQQNPATPGTLSGSSSRCARISGPSTKFQR